MKLDYDFTIIDLDGMPVKDQDGTELHAGRTAARLLMQIPEGGPDVMTKYDWATQLHKTGKIDLDKAGQVAFRKTIESMPNVWLVVRGALLAVLDSKQEEMNR